MAGSVAAEVVKPLVAVDVRIQGLGWRLSLGVLAGILAGRDCFWKRLSTAVES